MPVVKRVEGKFDILDPKQSKYAIESIEKNKQIKQQRTEAPKFLKNEEMYKDFTAKDFQQENPEIVKEKERIEREHEKRRLEAMAKKNPLGFQTKPKKEQRKISMDPIAKKVALDEHRRTLQTFDRFNEDFVTAYISEKSQKKIQALNKQNEAPIDQFVNVANVDEFVKPERVSKRLARMGICSRRVAEKLIEQGMIRVDGQQIDQNMQVTNQNLLQISAKTGIYTPVKENTRIWLYHKPRGMVTTHADTHGRMTVFQQLYQEGLRIPHVISVSYRVRVFGRMFNEQKLMRIRQGVTMNGQFYGPYICEVENRQNTNTWLHIKLNTGKNNEIRKVMRKFSLRVNRLIRVTYGPYTLGLVPNPNDLREVQITPDLRKIMYKYFKDRTQTAQTAISDAQSQKLRLQNKLVDQLIGSDNNKGVMESKFKHIEAYEDSDKEEIEVSEDEEEMYIEEVSLSSRSKGFGSSILNDEDEKSLKQ
ncbi:ribosomal large subunit pseudouridine synthase b [Stylonychia lemnae]|uniref:Ribosomal large subunit pseudouridine synthase b n=1 Tax=Stylonychia lemnae TaxID=5949 RepID=A0A078A703_STYLE|nr:ribosomal large subunit pseudouridine synthase b [Stylonychia lemnae]|eukprot:CDW78035.1 ribosomal large subunit pseudouridine synthase b [Stylonychia lemnae]